MRKGFWDTSAHCFATQMQANIHQTVDYYDLNNISLPWLCMLWKLWTRWLNLSRGTMGKIEKYLGSIAGVNSNMSQMGTNSKMLCSRCFWGERRFKEWEASSKQQADGGRHGEPVMPPARTLLTLWVLASEALQNIFKGRMRLKTDQKPWTVWYHSVTSDLDGIPWQPSCSQRVGQHGKPIPSPLNVNGIVAALL